MHAGGNHPQSWHNRPETRDKHWDDYVDPEHGAAFFRGYLEACLTHCIERVPVYEWHAHKRQALVEQAWREVGLLLHQQLIWVKARPVLTRSHYRWQHEPCFYGWPEGKMPEKAARPSPQLTSVWEIDQVGQQDGIHPTQKPTRIFEIPIEAHTKPGDVVLEPFSGSGTQLIAAERLKRRCCAIELAPAYVDVAVLRWEKAAGCEATLLETGETFAAVSARRKAEPDEEAASNA
jgi:DNA modification methylase